MMKKSQATLFIILGIVIIVLVALFMYARKTILMPLTPENLQSEMDRLEEKILDCVGEVGDKYIVKIGLQGGYLSTPKGTYRLWNDTTVSYLCWNQLGKPTCTNRLLTIEDMEKRLNEAIKNGLRECLNVHKFLPRWKRYNVEIGKKYDVETDIKREKVFVTLKYPIKLKGKEAEVSKEEFIKVFDYPLGRLYDVSQDILSFETQFGEFDQLMYMLQKRGEVMIYKLRPYPDKIYIIKEKDKPYLFQFAIQGEEL